MGNSSSSTIGAAAITVAAIAASATAAWGFSAYLPSETMEPQNRSSETKESQNRSSETEESQNRLSETTQDLNCLHVELEGNFGASPIYDPETKASLSVKNSERHSKRQCDESNEDTEVFSCMMRSASHISEREFALLEADLASLMAGVQEVYYQAQNSSNKNYMQLNDQNFQKLKWKMKLKANVNNQIPRHLTPSIHLQETIKIMSYNVWSIKYYKRDKRMNAVSHLIEQHSPDIILLQEVTPEVYIYFQSCTWWGIYKCSVTSVKGKQATKKCFCMMLSKLPVGKFFYKHFVNTKTCKGISAAKFTSKSNKMLTVATCHLKSPNGSCTYGIERASQAKEAIDLLKFPPNVVLGGDRNWDELIDGPFPLTSGWRDAWSNLKPEEHGYTYDTKSNAMLRHRRRIVQKRLDRFVCRLKDFDMVDIEIVGTEAIKGVSYKSNGQKLPVLPSDHYGLILTICAK